MSERYSPTLQIDHAQRFIAITDYLNRGLGDESLALFCAHRAAIASMGRALNAQLPPESATCSADAIREPKGPPSPRSVEAPSIDRYAPSIRIEHAKKFIAITDLLDRGLVNESFALFRVHRLAMANMGGALGVHIPGGRMTSSPDAPEPALPTELPELPGEDLRWRVAGHRDARVFWESGGQSVANIDAMLAIVGRSIADFPRALEFGCGCGRILLHMKEIADAIDLHGVDIDPESIAWCKDHIFWAKTAVNGWRPPLDFPDAHFDLVFNHSVFTHLDEDYQDVWLRELARVAKPGAAIVLSVAGEGPFTDFIHICGAKSDPTRYVERFNSKGFVYIDSDGWDDGPFPDFYHSTFHAPWYVYKHWGRYFDVKGYVVRGSLRFQDYVLLIRRDGPASPVDFPAWHIGSGRSHDAAAGSALANWTPANGWRSFPRRVYRKLRRLARSILR